ncbi:MAG: tRNA (adenosine(37)-N6)-dimethylallyltransferase MiaA [bacterium]|nr:tRNA (adenosine(37)-N6)-dimethylallyltransferase MiaA [bacterium]
MKKLIVLTGPTSTGKTDLAIQFCKEFNGEIISADSRQIYKGMDIGTGKAGLDDIVEKHDNWWKINDVIIHGYDLVVPMTWFSADHFRNFAMPVMQAIWKKGKLPFLVGGTWFYIKAVIDPFETIGIPPNTELRARLERLSVDALQNELRMMNATRLTQMNHSDRHNPRRLIRAIEVASAKTPKKRLALDCRVVFFGLTAPQEELYRRINERLDHRLRAGLVDEVNRLIEDGVTHERMEELGLEYRYVSRFLRGVISKEHMIGQLQYAIHHYAKRQLTFMKKDGRIQWFDITDKGFCGTMKRALEGFNHDTKN